VPDEHHREAEHRENPGGKPPRLDPAANREPPAPNLDARGAPLSFVTEAPAQAQAGDTVLLSYPSANRDEEVFDDPFRFDVGRNPNKHLAFGFGVQAGDAVRLGDRA